MIKNRILILIAIIASYVLAIGFVMFYLLKNYSHTNPYLMAIVMTCFLGSAALVFLSFKKR